MDKTNEKLDIVASALNVDEHVNFGPKMYSFLH